MKALGKTLLLSALFAMSTVPVVAQAADDAAKAQSAAAKFDLPTDIAVGDRIKLRSNVANLAGANGATTANAPRYTCLRVNRLGANGGLTVSVEDKSHLGTCDEPTGAGNVQVGDSYTITAEQLKNASYSRYGWVYGPMVVPFKYFPHDRSFEPSQSLGMYAGYRTSWFESRGMSFVGSAGVATMKVSQVVVDPDKPGSKKTKENTIAGYTFAGGVLFDLTREAKPFVAGLLVGADFVGRNTALDYPHKKRLWLALQVGWVQ